jgi:hypothetical protein
MHSEFVETTGRVRDFMRRSLEGENLEEEFGDLALRLFALQRKANPAYAKLCEARKVTTVDRWTDIPAVPTVAFKQVELTSLEPAERMGVFYSSGTTQRDRSRHFHSADSLRLYEESLWLWFERDFAGQTVDHDLIFLTPTAEAAPNSSLAHMFGVIAARRKDAKVAFAGFVDQEGVWQLNFSRVAEALKKAEAEGRGVALFGTAFLFVHLVDELERSGLEIGLPANSWALETGGYKGRTREAPKEELHRLISERSGISTDNIFGEYGMSELSSQAYAGADGLFRFPPWAQARIISPATGREASEGERGLIRVYDLANVWSVMAVQTEDVGIKIGNAIRLMGRAAEAEARGCSLMAA